MNIQEPLRLSNIDLSRLIYTKEKITSTKKIIFIKYMDEINKPFVFQMPTLLNLSKAEITKNYGEIIVSLTGKEKGHAKDFEDFIERLESKIKSDARLYASSWFKGNEIKFRNIITNKDNKKTIKIKLIKSNDFETKIRKDNAKKLNMEDINENTWVKMIIELYAIWINDKDELSIFLRPILVSFSDRNDYNYEFANSDSDDDEILETERNVINHGAIDADTEIMEYRNNIDNQLKLDVSNYSESESDSSASSSDTSDEEVMTDTTFINNSSDIKPKDIINIVNINEERKILNQVEELENLLTSTILSDKS